MLTLRPINPAEYADLHRFVENAFLSDSRPADASDEEQVFEFDRSGVVFDGTEIVGSSAIMSRDLTVPGGPLPTACVTWVAVSPTHRRRGILTRMMRTQLHDLHQAGREPVAALFASEAAIYGRFGYGLASLTAQVQVDTRAVTLRPDLPRSPGWVRAGVPGDVRGELEAVYERVRVERVGHLDRRGNWWSRRLCFPEHSRNGGAELRAAVHHGHDGPDAYALYAPRQGWSDNGPDGRLKIRELSATTPGAHAAIWDFLLGMDLVRSLEWSIAPSDNPLWHHAVGTDGIRTAVRHGLWIRLVDVDRALAARRYAVPVDVVLEVADEFCPWNAGRWRLTAGVDGTAECRPTGDSPDLQLSTTELGAAYLGGTTLAALAAAGRVTELRPGALAATSTAFAEQRAPHCPELF